MARGTGRDNRTTQWSVHSIEQHTGISRPNAAKAVKDLVDRSIWKKVRDGRHPIYEAVPTLEIPDSPSESFAVWLPNGLVDGVDSEVPPVELIRQTRCLAALRLMVELYAVQFLPTYGGVPRELLRTEFDRARVGEQGPFVTWGFRFKHKIAHPKLAGPFLTGQLKKGTTTAAA
jgi:hypothetical protein